MLVFISLAAQKQIDRLEADTKARVASRIDLLSNYPNVPGVRAMVADHKGSYRVRVGNFRIIFKFLKAERQIVITSVDDRKDVYDRDPDYARDAPRLRGRTGHVGRNERHDNHALAFCLRSLGQDLKTARVHAGMSQATLAKKLRRTQSAVSGTENGHFLASHTYVLAVLQACGLPPNWKRPR